MPLINLIVVLVIVGVALWLINTHIPMVAWMKTVINVVVALAVVVWLLQAFTGTSLLHYRMR